MTDDDTEATLEKQIAEAKASGLTQEDIDRLEQLTMTLAAIGKGENASIFFSALMAVAARVHVDSTQDIPAMGRIAVYTQAMCEGLIGTPGWNDEEGRGSGPQLHRYDGALLHQAIHESFTALVALWLRFVGPDIQHVKRLMGILFEQAGDVYLKTPPVKEMCRAHQRGHFSLGAAMALDSLHAEQDRKAQEEVDNARSN